MSKDNKANEELTKNFLSAVYEKDVERYKDEVCFLKTEINSLILKNEKLTDRNIYLEQINIEPSLKENHVLVPVDPTEAMIDAGLVYHCGNDIDLFDVYRAMIHAAQDED